MNNETSKTVLILLSDKRSGSTLMQRELLQHPLIKTVNYSPHAYLETHFWTKSAKLLNDRLNWKFVNVSPKTHEKRILSSYGSRKNAEVLLKEMLIKNEVEIADIEQNQEELIFKGWDRLCDKYADTVFFEKSPQILASPRALELLLKWIRQTNYDVKILVLVRNPLSIMYSAQKLFYTDPVKRQNGWVELMGNLSNFLDELNSDQWKLIRYEDLIQQPEIQFEGICNWLSISGISEFGKLSHRDSMEKWKSDKFFDFQLNEEAMDLAIKYGYSIQELQNENKLREPLWTRYKRNLKGKIAISIHRFLNRIVKPLKIKMIQLWRIK